MGKIDDVQNIWCNYQLLDEIARNENLSQRELSQKLGIAVGRTNQVIKRLVRKGQIKTRQINAKRVAYYLTPHGFSEKLRLVVRYIQTTVNFFSTIRLTINSSLEELRQNDTVCSAAIVGTSELAKVVYLSLQEIGLTLAAVYDLDGRGGNWLGMNVLDLKELPASPVDVVLVTEMDELGENRVAVEAIGRNVIEIRELLSEQLALFAMQMAKENSEQPSKGTADRTIAFEGEPLVSG